MGAIGMAVRHVFGHVGPSAARGLALRHDHGSAFLADHFQNQVRFWGMTPSYANGRLPAAGARAVGRFPKSEGTPSSLHSVNELEVKRTTTDA